MVRSRLMRRPVSVTMARIWAALSVWERARFIMSLLTCGSISAEDVEQLRVRPCPSLRHTLLTLLSRRKPRLYKLTRVQIALYA